MRLHRFLLVSLFLLAGCSDATAVRVSRSYMLESIDGHSLPVQIGSLTAEWGTITLSADGRVVAVTHWHQQDAQPVPLDYDETDTDDYRIHGDSITIGVFTPCREACPRRFEGEITGSTLTYTPQETPHTQPIFLYHVKVDAPD